MEYFTSIFIVHKIVSMHVYQCYHLFLMEKISFNKEHNNEVHNNTKLLL